jgi:hypothetical protein
MKQSGEVPVGKPLPDRPGKAYFVQISDGFTKTSNSINSGSKKKVVGFNE